MLICGCDPGITGAVAVLTEDGALVDVFDMPLLKVAATKTAKRKTRIATASLALLLRRHEISHAYVEEVSSAPMRKQGGEGVVQGTTSMFSLGKSAGILEGVLAGLTIPTTLVTPQKWKRGAGLTSDKALSLTIARATWPGDAGFFTRKRDDGRAEAALLALYGLRTMPTPGR